MKPLGKKKSHRTIKGHQNCGICQPSIKNGKAKEKIILEKEIHEEEKDNDISHQGRVSKNH